MWKLGLLNRDLIEAVEIFYVRCARRRKEWWKLGLLNRDLTEAVEAFYGGCAFRLGPLGERGLGKSMRNHSSPTPHPFRFPRGANTVRCARRCIQWCKLGLRLFCIPIEAVSKAMVHTVLIFLMCL